MANYYAYARTNYFNVNDDAAFKAALSEIPGIEFEKGSQGWVISATDDGGWPCWDENDCEIDLPALVAEHLAAEEVAVFQEVGHERLRYLTGYAEAINHRGERASVGLEDIYRLAAELGSTVTEAAY